MNRASMPLRSLSPSPDIQVRLWLSRVEAAAHGTTIKEGICHQMPKNNHSNARYAFRKAGIAL